MHAKLLASKARFVYDLFPFRQLKKTYTEQLKQPIHIHTSDHTCQPLAVNKISTTWHTENQQNLL